MTDSKSSGLFSSLSIGRASRSPRSSEPLTHPLLGASTSSLNLSSSDVDGSNAASNGGAVATSPTNAAVSPKASMTFPRLNTDALPYKPRQRHSHQGSNGSINATISPNMAPTSATIAPTAPPTTSTSSTFALPPSASEGSSETPTAGPSTSSATSRLQVQSLKASAQRLGLVNGSMGMAILDTLIDKGQLVRTGAKQGEEGEWGDVLKVLTSGKAILLLPTTSASTLPVTPQILRDHIAFLSAPIPLHPVPPSRMRSSDSLSEKGKELAADTVTMAVTLSGIIGSLRGNTFTADSAIDAESPMIASLRDSISRSTSLSSLRPTTLSSSVSFPEYTLSTQSTSLAFPALGKIIGGSTQAKEKDGAKASQTKLGRMNPFMSLFGSASAPTVTISEPTAVTGSPDRQASPGPSLSSLDAMNATAYHAEIASKDVEGFTVQAYTLSKPLRSAEVHKALSKAIKSHLKEELVRMPEKVLDRVMRLVIASITPPGSDQESIRSQRSIDSTSVPAINFANPNNAGEQLQEFMESIYDDLVEHYRNDSTRFVAEAGLRRKGSGGKPWSRANMTSSESKAEEQGSKEAKDKRRRQKEERAEKEGTEGTERVEAAVMNLLYNRLFSPLESDDSRHDEALASRIAALNMLDLSLDHLGLITRPEDGESPGAIASGLTAIVGQIGDELQNLITPSCLTPKAKADVLVRAHKLVVDGLAQLPAIQLRPEGEPYKPSAPLMATPPAEDEENRGSAVPASDDSINVRDGQDVQRPGTVAQAESSQLLREQAETTAPASVPAVIVSDDSETLQIEKAMSDSVVDLHADTHARSSESEGSTATSTHIAVIPISSTKPSTSGADLILPIIIYAVVKANTPQLASQLMYLRRYRSGICLTGEASYAMVNLTAVVEFLEHVDFAELGLGSESDKVMSVADLSPIGLNYLDQSNEDAQSIASASSKLRGRVFQVSELAGTAAGSANKVITGVIDSSWSAVRGLIGTTPLAPEEDSEATAAATAAASGSRPTLRARQPSTFSLASVTASVANIAAAAAATTAAARSRASSRASEMPQAHTWQANQELVDVTSRPQSIRELDKEEYPSDSESISSSSDDAEVTRRTSNIDDPFVVPNTGGADKSEAHSRALSDARSIRSVSSMMSKEGRKEDAARGAERVSLSDRLANIGGFGKPASATASGVTSPPLANDSSKVPSPEKDHVPAAQTKPASFLAGLAATRSVSSSGTGHGRRGSLLAGSANVAGRSRSDSNPSAPSPPMQITSRPASVMFADEIVPQPIERFMTCDLGDMQLSEIGELLRDYRRLANYISSTHPKVEAGASLTATRSNAI